MRGKKTTMKTSLCLLLSFAVAGSLVSCKKAPEQAATPPPANDTKPTEVAKPATAAPQASAEKISFSTQVLPILSNNCFACHGPDSHNQTSPFRLDTEEQSRANLAKQGESPRHGVVPGKPEESLLLQRIVTTDPHEIMPPPYAKKTALTAEQIATLTEWIRLPTLRPPRCVPFRCSIP